ncbi:LysR family transcriptional regulator [Lactiplantibacillus plantarum]|nr:LysR family transcriptional regulator [Lactiplantibacillus plantarum]
MFKQLETFCAVYETRNFSHAAEQLFISQPTVSTQIKQLEARFTNHALNT